MNKILTPFILSILVSGAGYQQSAQAGIKPLQLIRSAAQWVRSNAKDIGKLFIANSFFTGIQMAWHSKITTADGQQEAVAAPRIYPTYCQPDQGVVAPEAVPAIINTRITDFINHPERIEAAGARLWRGILLTGQQENQLGYYIARATNSRVLHQDAARLIDTAQGSGSRAVHQLFVRAQYKTIKERIKQAFSKFLSFFRLRRAQPRKPTIVIIDGIDAIGRPRMGVAEPDDIRSQERERALEQLLTELDGAHQKNNVPDVFIVATGNTPADDLDAALVRPGRLKVIELQHL